MGKELRIVTLNCWGLLYISKHREQRIGKVGDELAKGRYDIATLQEIWMEKDYKEICKKVKSVLPYHHYFHSGVIGSGMCIFSKWPIVDTLYHRYSLNSYAHRILEGDWFGGKGVGLCVIEAEDHTINVYTTHNTACYAPPHILSSDEHFTDRLVQCYELSEFVRFTGTTSDVNLLTGDFNTEDNTLGLKVAKVNADLRDAWLEHPNLCKDEPCCTVDAPDNCYTDIKTNYSTDAGKRIDYILYGTKTGCHVTCKDCKLTFKQIPGTSISYSDHTGVEAVFQLERRRRSDNGQQNFTNSEDRLAVLLDMLPYIQTSIQEAKQQRISYIVKSLLIFVLLTFLWLSGIFHMWTSFYARCGALVVIVALVVLGVLALSIGGSVKTTELNQLIGRKRDIRLQVKRLESYLGKISN